MDADATRQEEIESLKKEIAQYKKELEGEDLPEERRDRLENYIYEARKRLNNITPQQQQLAPAPAPVQGKIYTSPPTESPPPLYPNHTIPFVRLNCYVLLFFLSDTHFFKFWRLLLCVAIAGDECVLSRRS